jgi:hypothetical protein
MITINDILNNEQVLSIKEIMDNEIETALCPNVPFYQSYSNMHIKHKDNKDMSVLINKMIIETEKATNESLNISQCFFNICKKDSQFGLHNHKNSYITCVYFLKNCEGNGTIFQINNSYLQLLSKDNSLSIFDPQIMHTIPPWAEKDRYTIAMNFTKK